VIIDTSAIVAILAGEPDAVRYAQRIEQDPTPRIGTPALLEASLVLTRWFGESAEAALDSFVREAGAEIVPFDLPQFHAAQLAYRRYGKGRHPAGLNFGDCMSYALAKVCDEALLFKGDDFSKTDIRPAG
jgi:ribonuclease VapC